MHLTGIPSFNRFHALSAVSTPSPNFSPSARQALSPSDSPIVRVEVRNLAIETASALSTEISSIFPPTSPDIWSLCDHDCGSFPLSANFDNTSAQLMVLI